ncbi:pericentriolar material 1 protein-like isoform X2 [Periplaneta americana]|uniref:pericentriolar material 1 protein-like isoform X2 n=1 Tax=Periplaneta americana TaxID=6978 RepID=UPI0037E7143C
MAPGINGRQTGTVPKIKAHNDSLREFVQTTRREPSFNNIPNNLVTLEWQPALDIGHSRTRKTSNTQSASLDLCDLGSESSVSHDNTRFVPPHYSHGEEQQLALGGINRCLQEVNGHSECSASSSSSRQSRTPRNVLPDWESKSNNITKMPDRNQVVSRLNQIRDYIKQTSSLMDTLKNSGDPRLIAQYQKLSKMVSDLKDSEGRLQALLPELGKELDPKMQETKSGKCISEVVSASGNPISDLQGSSVNSHASPVPSAGSRSVSMSSPISRSHSEEPSGAVLKSSDSARRNELKMKVEESQRRLQALQEHQAAMVTLQQKAQAQLKEARMAQDLLTAPGGSLHYSGPPLSLGLPAGDEFSAGCMNGTSNSQASGTQQTVEGSPGIQSNMQHLADRLHTLHELYENRNQLVQMLGERDEELVSEHMVLQDKLQELQYKKQHMDQLVSEFQALNNLPCITTADSHTDDQSNKDGSEDGEAECSDVDGEADYESVRVKIAELNMMKAQLAQLKGIMSAVQNRASTATQNGIEDQSGSRQGEDYDLEEQAVNLRRQKKDKSRGGSMKGLARSNSNTSTSGGSSKPDNIVQATSEVERTRDIQNKTVQLQEARARLQHLQDLLAAVSDFHNRGQPVPDQYIDLLSQEAAREDAATSDSRRSETPSSKTQRRSSDRERTPVRQPVQDSCSGLPEGPEVVTLEMVQEMTRDLRQQTQCLQEERERLVSARRELGKLQRELPLREKKTNTQIDAQTHQQLLQAELQAKRRELEELMRKDQGQTSAINQDVCSEVSADKSETPAYSFLAEGTINATWGGSTQGTLDDLADQDNDNHEQSAGYSSDEGQEDEEEDDHTVPAGSSQLRLTQLNNSSNNNNNRDPLSLSVTTTRDILSMSLDSGRQSLPGNINANNSNSASAAGSGGHNQTPAVGCVRAQRQGPASHNVWRKESTDSGMSVPRAVWTPSTQQTRQENLCTSEEVVSSNNLETNNSSSTAGQISSNPSTTWWQQQALQLQHQLEVTSNLCQNMLLEQAHQHQQHQQQQQLLLQHQQQTQQQHGNNLLPAVGPGNNIMPHWTFPPPPYPLPPQAHSLTTGLGSHLLTSGGNPASDTYYQQLLAISQLQQQQMLLTTVNQCCHLLWLQQREIMALRSAVHALQDKTPCGNGSHEGESYSPPIVIGQPEETVLITSNQNSAHPTPHQSQSNLTRIQQSAANPSLTSFSPHQNLKLSYSGGLFQSPEELTGSSGVTSAHSLPNLSQATTSANSVFSSHHVDGPSSTAPLNNFSSTAGHNQVQNVPAGTLTLSFPVSNNVNFNNRSQQQPLSSLIQCSAPQPGSGAPWLQHGAPGGTPGLLQAHSTPSPVPALNNQVPPGNRANNYWDNFRSYSRQNLLSTSTKSNEGVSHSPSPLVDRSHNTLRGSVSQSSSLATPDPQSSTAVLSHSIGAIYSGQEQIGPACNMARKEKLNTEQYQSSQDNLSMPGPTHANMSDTASIQCQLLGPSNASSSCPRLRNRHNCGDFQLQPNTSRSKQSQRQTLSIDNVPRDSQLQTNVLGMRGLIRCSGSQVLPSSHNFSSLSEFNLETDSAMDARNLTVRSHEPQDHQSFSLTSTPLPAYQGNEGPRNEAETSEFLHVNSQGIIVDGVNKGKNPKAMSVSHTQQNSRYGSSGNITDQKPQRTSNSLFEALSETVYTEVAALISANETRPHFLIQLFRDLQMISCDPLRQRTLQSIQEVVSRYLASGPAVNHHSPQVDIQQSNQNESIAIGKEHVVPGSAVASDDENAKDEGSQYHLAESLASSLTGQGNDAHCMPNIAERCESVSEPHSIAESEDGAAAMLPSTHSPPCPLPRNAAWSIADGLSLPAELPGRSNKLDWEVQAVLVDLLPFLKAHLDDTCSASLLEAVRRLTLQLVPAQSLSLVGSPVQNSSQAARLGCCYQGQLDALLEDALLKFQGCRLRDISEELITVVAEVLLSELTFLRLVDTVSRGDNSNEDSDECCKNSSIKDHAVEDVPKNSGPMSQSVESTQHILTPEVVEHNYIGSRETTLGTTTYNGDLAEADQSHHEETDDMPELEAESAAAMSASEKVPTEGQSTQAEGAVAMDSCIMDGAGDTNEILQVDDMIPVHEESGDFNKTEMEDWEVEQDREQGLDRVPIRLSTEQQRPAAACSGSNSPERENHNLVQHPANQPDAPSP